MKQIGLVLFLGLFISQAFAQDAMKIAGIWWNDKKTLKIEVKEENGKFIGTVIYINPEKYVNGEPEKDFNNPDAKLEKQPPTTPFPLWAGQPPKNGKGAGSA